MVGRTLFCKYKYKVCVIHGHKQKKYDQEAVKFPKKEIYAQQKTEIRVRDLDLT